MFPRTRHVCTSEKSSNRLSFIMSLQSNGLELQTCFSIWKETRGMLRLADASTATYVAILDRQGNFLFGVGDMEIHNQLSIDWVRSRTFCFLLSK
jgi:hypothetical protein